MSIVITFGKDRGGITEASEVLAIILYFLGRVASPQVLALTIQS